MTYKVHQSFLWEKNHAYLKKIREFILRQLLTYICILVSRWIGFTKVLHKKEISIFYSHDCLQKVREIDSFIKELY